MIVMCQVHPPPPPFSFLMGAKFISQGASCVGGAPEAAPELSHDQVMLELYNYIDQVILRVYNINLALIPGISRITSL